MRTRVVLSRWMRLAIAVVALSLAACDATPTPPADGVVLSTSRAGMFDTGCPAALIDGTLVVDAAWGTAIVTGEERMPVIWPFGFTARLVGDVVEVLDPSGVVVARTGEHVALGGGQITSDNRWSTCGPPLERG